MVHDFNGHGVNGMHGVNGKNCYDGPFYVVNNGKNPRMALTEFFRCKKSPFLYLF